MDGGGLGIVVLFLLVAGAVAWYRWHRAEQRRQALARFAASRGLTFNRRDVHSTLGLGFALFRQGDDQGVENVIHGVHEGRPFRVFDLWTMTESTDAEGNTSRSYKYYTCAVRQVQEAFWPHLRISRENLFTRVKDRTGFRDIEFESDEFNRTFEVRCEDRRFASTLIDPRMMQWLLSTGGDFGFEVRGSHLLVATKRVTEPTEFLVLHQVVNLFEDRIPEVTWSLYPGG